LDERLSRPTLFVPLRTFVLSMLGLILVLDAADAHTFMGVPCPWIAMFIACPLIIVYSTFSRLTATPGVSIYLVLLVWLLGNTFYVISEENYQSLMPELATTSYPVFVFLRGYSFFGFLFLSLVVFNYARTGSQQRLLEFISMLGVLVTLYALYILAAQRLQLPMPAKTRFGTGEGGAISGGESGHFGDANERFLFRTIGSFREPSFLGIWLIAPFFLSIAAAGGKLINWRTIVIGLGILSTGSLTAAAAVVGAFVIALQLLNPFGKRAMQILLAIAATAVALSVALNLLAQAYLDVPADFSFADQYLIRIERILSGGAQATNRSQAVTRFLDSEFSLAGLGMGNAHLFYSQGAPFIVSFLSLYFHVWFAGGAIAMTLLITYLLLPLFAVLLKGRENKFDDVWYVAAYLAWVIVFTVNDENLNVMSALCIGLLWARIYVREPRSSTSERLSLA
jgi:hypothetical protein